MVRELITIQVGQCGNQIGRQFWSLALQEHAKYASNGCFDESMSSFFRNVDSRYDDPVDLPFQDGKNQIKCLKARAILVDMEQGPVSETLNGPIGDLFDSRQFITDVSGSGNNWAHGHAVYGPQYREELIEQLRRAAELCDSLQSFFIMHSLGGGTGSGLGTYILGILQDEYPDVYRFVTAVFPSADDDVITSRKKLSKDFLMMSIAYNSVLSLEKLTEHADCVLPIENQALLNMCNKMTKIPARSKDAPKPGSRIIDTSSKNNDTPFADMNNIVAHLLTSLTSSMRFEGSLNIDLNEITTNLVPYPRLHYLMSSISPMFTKKSTAAANDHRVGPRGIDQMFSDALLSRDNQLLSSNPASGTVLACGLLLRGNVQVSDINRNIDRLSKDLRMVYWNKEGFKVGVCSAPAINQPTSLLALSNNCCISENFREMGGRFRKLYRRKAHVHHYTEYVEPQVFTEALSSLDSIVAEYEHWNNASAPISRTRQRRRQLL